MYVATVMSIQRNYADHAPRKQGGDVGEVEQPHGDDTLTPDSDEERYEMYGEVVGFARNGKGMPASSNASRCESVESVFTMCWKNVYGEAIVSGRRGAKAR